MPKKTQVKTPEVIEEVVEETIKATADVPESSKTQSVVVDKNGQLVRVYDKETHGDKFADLAKQFANKKGYKIVK